MRRIADKVLALLPVLCLGCGVLSYAQEIRDIETTVYLFRNGNAKVVQKWDVNVTSGTEWYIPIENPGKSYIHDMSVSENGEAYASDGRKWNSNRSLEAKTRRCGIVEKGGGNIELCWGQGEYGDHVYTLSYIIDNLVQSYPECDGFHWHFLNDEWSTKPQHASIRIENSTGADKWYWERPDSCNVRFWGFGMEGDSSLDAEDGSIFFESTKPFRYGSFFSALVSFDKGLFLPQVEGEGSFEELKNQAMDGSDYNSSENKPDLEEIIYRIIMILLFVVPAILTTGAAIFLILRRLYWKISGNRYVKKIFGASKIDGWSRDVPFEANPTSLFSLMQCGDNLKPDKYKSFSNVVAAYFLKWIQDGIVTVEKDAAKESRVNLRFAEAGKDISFEDKMEARVYKGALVASLDGLLEAGEFKKWSYKNCDEVSAWPGEAILSGREAWQNASQQECRKAVEFKNFLEDFTLMGERGAPEVGLWKQYMVVAATFGIADKVAKNFEKLFPHLMQQYAAEAHMPDTFTTYYVLDSLRHTSSSMMKSAVDRQSEKRAAAAAAQRRSGGGGGSISFGGGGGGFGGGHGGGSR